MLFDGRRGSTAAELLDIGRDMQRLHFCDRRNACLFAPKKKLARGLAVRPARVFVADLRGEEFPKARLRAITGRCNEERGLRSRNDRKLVHSPVLRKKA